MTATTLSGSAPPPVSTDGGARPRQIRRGRVLYRLLAQKASMVAVLFLGVVIVTALLAPLIAPFDPNDQDLLARNQPPSSGHWLGTDDYGRDQLSRLFYAGRVSILASVEAVAVGGLLGVILGMFGGFVGGPVGSAFGRFIDMMMAVPGLLLAITVISVLGPGLTNAMFAVGLLLAPAFYRVAHAATLDVTSETYIEAARALGCPTRRVLFNHVLPNMLAPVMVQTAILLGVAVSAEASLSFIGLGVQPPTASWGSMLSNANAYLTTAPHLVYVPGLMIAFTVLSFSLLGDGLARALGTNRQIEVEKR